MSQAEQKLRVIIPAEQIQKRVREMARQISDDYQGKTVHALGILENGFIFLADLGRALEVPVICTFIKPRYRDDLGGVQEIFFSHELDIRGQHMVPVEGLGRLGGAAASMLNGFGGPRGAAVTVSK